LLPMPGALLFWMGAAMKILLSIRELGEEKRLSETW